MLSATAKEDVRARLLRKIERISSDIIEYRELTKPIPPENSIGRISRMDAINNKSVNEAALRNSLQKLQQLERALAEIDEAHFGICKQCGGDIEAAKLMVMPESVRCVTCVKASR